jgi:predicted ferric reductase
VQTDRGLPFAVLLTFAAAWALFLSLFIFPTLSADISEHVYWYMGRSSGFVAYWLLFASVALGLAVSSRVFDGMLGRPWVFELHKFLSIFVLLVMAFHALIMLPDPWTNFTLTELLVPFKSHYRNTAVGLGQLVLYGSAIVTVSFYLKGVLGQKGWRWLHYTSFALFLGALGHGIWAGTDSGATVVQFSYLGSAVAVLFLTFFRILATRAAGGKPRPAPARPVKKTAEMTTPAAEPSTPEAAMPSSGEPTVAPQA